MVAQQIGGTVRFGLIVVGFGCKTELLIVLKFITTTNL